MPDYLSIINRVILEHERIGSGIKAVGESTNDIEATFSLQQASAGWSTASLKAFGERLVGLGKTIESLAYGLERHFAFEEKVFPPLLGEMLMKSVLLTHQEIRTRVTFARSLVQTAPQGGIGQQELLALKSRIQTAINGITTLVQGHAAEEETVLNMLKRSAKAAT